MELQKKYKIAICAPSATNYSETFIQAHKNLPALNVTFYYGNRLPKNIEGKGTVIKKSIFKKTLYKTKVYFFSYKLTFEEFSLLESFKANKIDAVLAEYGTMGANLVRICENLKIPLIVHFHGYDATKFDVLEKYKTKYQSLFEYASKVIVVSQKMKKDILSLGCHDEKIINNTYGPDNSFFNLKPYFSNKQFIGIGRFVDKKAPYYTLLAFRQVLDKHPDAKLIIGGDGPLYNTCRNLIKYLEIEKNVFLPGVISPNEFKRYLSESCAFVQHSVTADDGDSEGTPVAVLEASAAGLPVISTNHAGIPDVIFHGETGLLCDEHNVDNMAENMNTILNDPDFAKKLGDSGQNHIRKNHTIDKHLNVLSTAIINAIEDYKY